MLAGPVFQLEECQSPENLDCACSRDGSNRVLNPRVKGDICAEFKDTCTVTIGFC